jgi:hypothetical protein
MYPCLFVTKDPPFLRSKPRDCISKDGESQVKFGFSGLNTSMPSRSPRSHPSSGQLLAFHLEAASRECLALVIFCPGPYPFTLYLEQKATRRVQVVRHGSRCSRCRQRHSWGGGRRGPAGGSLLRHQSTCEPGHATPPFSRHGQ